jgi:HK97 family phage portal protein
MSDRRDLITVLSKGVRTKDMGLVTDARPLWGGGMVRDWFPGAWQANLEIQAPTALTAYAPIYAALSQISGDVSKLGVNLLKEVEGEEEILEKAPKNSPFWQVLRRPNRYQDRIQFFEYWMLCKLIHGNAYALKQFDQRGIVTDLYLLDPRSTRARITDDGAVYYSAPRSLLSQLPDGATAIPSRFIIHDRGPTFWDPLVGVSPMVAAALSGTLGLKIQQQSAAFFGNMSRPSGLITGPNQIPTDEAERLKAGWQENYSGLKLGQTAVLGDGLTYQALSMAAEASQLAEQLGISANDVATAFGLPAYMLNQGQMPTSNNVAALEQQYYSRTLQKYIEKIELLLTEGLSVPDGYSVEFDLDGLLRMDGATQMTVLAAGVKGMILKPNEARAKLNRRAVKGGDAVYGQHQDYSTEALNERDRGADPFGTAKPAAAPEPAPAPAAAPSAGSSAEDPTKTIESFLEKAAARFQSAPLLDYA